MWTVMFGSLACTGGRRLRHDGKYYLDGEDGNTYLCQRTGEAAGGTIVLQYMPHELVENYFTAVNM